MSRRFLLKALAVSMTVVALDASAAYSSGAPQIYGNIGFHYTGTRAEEGAKSNSAYTTLSANAQSFLWRPWFATYNLGATASMLQSDSGSTTTRANLLYSHLDLSLLPRSRFPFRFTMNYGNDVESWGIGSLDWLDMGDKQTLYMNARQSYITRKGDRIDGWITQRTRNYFDAELKDTTYGAKIKTRGKRQNLYANGSYQTRSNSLTDLETTNVIASMTHNYFPTSEFYVKTLVSTTHYEDNSLIDHTSTFNDRVTDRNQVSSFMYWRPQYRPYTATAGLRAYRRGNSLTDLSGSNQIGFDANAATNYTINRRMMFTATANTSIINTKYDENDETNAQSANVSALLNYRSDRIMLRDFVYNWYINGGIGNQVSIHFEEAEYSQNLNVGAGHSAHRVWVTGNRSTVRLNLTQSAREFVKYKPLDTGLNISHSISGTWNKDLRKGRFYSQLSVLDSHVFDNTDSNSQIINLQFSRVMPINRLSQWGAHLSAQGSRLRTEHDESKGFFNEFVTTGTGRLNYQHARLFGIYKLKFRAELDVAHTGNLDREARRQADAEARLGYNVGKLSTALIGRGVMNNTGLSMGVVVMQINRSF